MRAEVVQDVKDREPSQPPSGLDSQSPATFPYDVFLSYNSADKPRVRSLANQLQDAGLRVWFDEWVIQPGDDIYLGVERGLQASRTLILCLSPSALGSSWVTLERDTALFRDPTNVGRRFVPLLLADCTLPDALRRYRYVDYRSEEASALAELLTACGFPLPAAELTSQVTRSWPSILLTTRKDTPQWTAYQEVDSEGGRLVRVACVLVTSSVYFRFGLKLLTPRGRLFGDGSIQSQDAANLVIHVGRNSWDRPGITSRDVFLAAYVNGLRQERDRPLFVARDLITTPLELAIDSSYLASFSVNGSRCYTRIIPPAVCRRAAMLAWGDHDDYSVEILDLTVTTARLP